MTIKCEFLFKRAALIYYTDEQIAGTLRLTTTKHIHIAALTLSFMGGAEVSWSEYDKSGLGAIEHNDSTKLRNKITYNGQELYHNETQSIAENALLAAGSSIQAAFCFNVPAKLPASCRQDYGQIAYKLCVKLKRKAKCSKLYTRHICIKRKLDLCHNVNLLTNSSCVRRHFTLALPQIGYMPGQSIPFRLGNAQTTLSGSLHANILLRQCTSYCSQMPKLQVKNVIKSLAAVECRNMHLYSTQQGSLAIPLTVNISTVESSQRLLCISYYIEAQVYDAKLRFVERLRVPIVIATNVPRSRCSTAASEEDKPFCYDNMAVNTGSVENLYNSCQPTNYAPLRTHAAAVSNAGITSSERRKLLQTH